MSANIEAIVRAGIEAYRAGKKSEARKLLEKAIELDDYNEQAWMWLSAVVETEEEKRTCLENVVVINPDNAEAKRGLKMLGVEGSTPSTPASSESNASPFSQSSSSDFGDVDFVADAEDSGGQYDIATSSASSVFQGRETSSGEYDSWVDNLNLGGSDSSEIDDRISSAGPLAVNNIQDMFGLDDSDDIFGGTNDPFGSEPLFDDDDDDSSFTSGPFGGNDEDDRFVVESSPPPVTRKASAAPVTSPGAENIKDDSFLGELASADLSGGDFIMGDDDFDAEGQTDFSPDELFSFIPDEISATRLPGTKQGVSFVSMLVLVILVAMNFGAIWLIVSGLG